MRMVRLTHHSPRLYWVGGALLIWCLLPISVIDALIALEWNAPNPQCDSPGIPLMAAFALLLPWSIAAIVISGVLAIPATWNRQGGADVLDVRLGIAPWKWIVSLPVLVVISLLVCDVAVFFWHALVPQQISSDCGGVANLVTVELRGPIIQFVPLWEAVFALWLLHLRALALSPRLP